LKIYLVGIPKPILESLLEAFTNCRTLGLLETTLKLPNATEPYLISSVEEDQEKEREENIDIEEEYIGDGIYNEGHHIPSNNDNSDY